MYYYGKLANLTDLNVQGYPKEYPVFFLATDEELHEYSRLMADAILKGFSPKWRKMFFSTLCREGYTHEEIYNEAQRLPDLTEAEYNLYKKVPHWDVMSDAKLVLERYIQMIDKSVEQYDGSDLQKIVEEIMEKVQSESERIA